MAIMTVNGTIDAKAAGYVLPHEHLLIDLLVFCQKPADPTIPYDQKLTMDKLIYVKKDPYLIFDNAVIDEVDVAIQEMKRCKALGIDTVVDVTLDTIARDPLKLKRISDESGMNIVMGAGYYVGAAHPAYIKEKTQSELAKEILKDVYEGVGNTGIKAGVIGEIGTSAVVSENEWKCVLAAGEAQRESGKAMHVHTSLYEENGVEILKKLKQVGANVGKVAIDHIDVDIREDYIERLLDMGAYVEFDNFGKEFYISKRTGATLNGRFAYDLERAETIARLVKKGYTDRILVTNDICLKNMLIKYGGCGYGHVVENIIPMLMDCGLTEREIDIIYRENPVNFLDEEKR